jgi:hypothetical protein
VVPTPPKPKKRKLRSDRGRSHNYPADAIPGNTAVLKQHTPHTLTLTFRHYVNGTAYGPGDVRVPYALAQLLGEQETRARQVEERFHSNSAFLIGPGGRRKRVAPETFDAAHAMAMPLATISN